MLRPEETTIPAAADSGLRTFDVPLSDGRIASVTVGLREDVALYDERPSLVVTGNVVTNEELVRALLPLAAVAVRTPGQSFPDQA